MSLGLPAVAQIEFDSQVKAAYQASSILRPHVRVRTGVTGSTCRFRRYARSVASPRVTQSDVVPMNTVYSEATATLADWVAADYTDKLDQVLVNFEERGILATNIGAALGRRFDQMILDALDAANAALNIAVNSTGLTFDKMRQIVRIFDDRAVPMGMRKLVISARGKDDLMNETKFTSGDFVNAKMVQTGGVPQVMGLDIVVMESRDEGGLPLSGSNRTCFAFDTQAIGLAIGIETPLENNYVAEKMSWLSAQALKAGAVAIDALGIIEIGTEEA